MLHLKKLLRSKTMSDEQRISLEDLPAYIEGLLAKEEQLQGQIRIRNSDLEKALATIATLTADLDTANARIAELVEAVDRMIGHPDTKTFDTSLRVEMDTNLLVDMGNARNALAQQGQQAGEWITPILDWLRLNGVKIQRQEIIDFLGGTHDNPNINGLPEDYAVR